MKLTPFPDPPLEDAYVLADGGYQHWILPEWGAFWSLVLTQTYLEMGRRAVVRPHVFDCSTEDADTPQDHQRGDRHPGDAHDGGSNFDLGYPLASDRRGFNAGPVKNGQLSGSPDTLDVPYLARMVACAAQLEGEFGPLIQVMAFDRRIRPPLKEAIGMIPGLSQRDMDRAETLADSGQDDSWWIFHFNHMHLRHYAIRGAERFGAECQARLQRLLSPGQATVLTLEERVAAVERRLAALEAR